MKKTNIWLIVVLLASLVVLSGCSIPQFPDAAAAQSATSAPTATPVVAQAPASAGAVAALEGTLEQIYAQVNPSVVNIRVVETVSASSFVFPQIPGFPDIPSPPQGPQTQQALGSGFVWDTQGHIVTNNHVVQGAEKISVTFYDGTTVPAEVTATDPDSDLAVIQVDVPADRLQPVQMADSTQVKVGELAIAIGNPFGLQGTMTMGIISALGRTLPAQSVALQGQYYSIPDIIQTDAPINPGNSGGVLVDDTGSVIGVTAAIESSVRSSAGIGFVIPSQIVQKVVPALIDTGHYDQPWIGISGTSMVPELATAMDLGADQRGALVIQVLPDSPAAKAGLQGSDRQVQIDNQTVPVGGDVIVAVDGQPVQDFEDLIAYLADSTEVGQTITLTVLRDGKNETIELTLAARPASEASGSQAGSPGTGGAYLGIAGLTLTPEIAQAMDLSSDQEGVLVSQVQSNSPADQAGLQGSDTPVTVGGQQLLVGGDVITAIDGQPMANMPELQALLQEKTPGQTVTLTILRDGNERMVEVVLGERPVSAP
jgi:S1-C subfamily serine protease